jgi:hypothetical protein
MSGALLSFPIFFHDLHGVKLKVKDNVKFALEQATKAQRGSRSITPLFL